jgi:hypothetical protein
MNEGFAATNRLSAGGSAVHGRDYKSFGFRGSAAGSRNGGNGLSNLRSCSELRLHSTSGRLRVRRKTVATAAKVCRRLGMGVEMEQNMGLDLVTGATRGRPGDRINLVSTRTTAMPRWTDSGTARFASITKVKNVSRSRRSARPALVACTTDSNLF